MTLIDVFLGRGWNALRQPFRAGTGVTTASRAQLACHMTYGVISIPRIMACPGTLRPSSAVRHLVSHREIVKNPLCAAPLACGGTSCASILIPAYRNTTVSQYDGVSETPWYSRTRLQQNQVTAALRYDSTVLHHHRVSPPLCCNTVRRQRPSPSTSGSGNPLTLLHSAALCSILRHQGRCEFFE